MRRHLLRSVCDELMVVHGGGVERFDREIDEYAAWLREQEGGENGADGSARTGDATDRREQRRLAAEARRRLKPLSDRVVRIERELESLRADLGALDGTRITPHGRALAKLPLHPRLAHMLMVAGKPCSRWHTRIR